MEKNEKNFKSRLGFLLVGAGCAIGIGNVWKFPYIVGQYGGGFFVLFYIVFLVIMGIPVMTMEFAVGRASRKSTIQGYKTLEAQNSKWHIHGFFAIGACYLLMMYYTTVSGWMLLYFWKFLKGAESLFVSAETSAAFTSMLANPREMIVAMAITVIAGFTVCSFSLQKGLERVTKILMLGLLTLIIVLAIHSVGLPGAKEGLKFYLLPDFQKVKEAGLFRVVMAAMNQAFFTLSLGIGAMEIFGSYMSKNKTLTSESAIICSLDTFVAIFSGLIIFPACFSYSINADAGPSLIFITLPKVFLNMAGGRVWGTLFFLFMTFASFSTVIAVFENIIAVSGDTFKINRRKAALINCIALLVLSLPCVFGYNIWSNLHIIGARDVLDSEDFIVSNILLPLGSVIYLLFCTSKWGWGFDKYLKEANTGKGIKISPKLKIYFRYILPAILILILVAGLI